MAGCPFNHNSLRTDVYEIVYNLIDNTRLSPKVVLRNLVNMFYLFRWFLEVSHLTEGVSVLKGLW